MPNPTRQASRPCSNRASGAAIDIHAGYIPSERVRSLIASCDAYVSLHRSEGIGLTIADAMGLGKPVIATGWSGNTDFMDVSNSFPVSYRLVEIEENVGPYHEGEVWAEPSVEHAAELMRFVVDHPEEASVRGEGRAGRFSATTRRSGSPSSCGNGSTSSANGIGSTSSDET